MDIHINKWPYFAADEIAAVAEVLQSGKVNYWTGEHGKLFEKEFAEFFGAKYAIAVANGTNALELALLAINIGKNDEVIVPCRTFIATASAVVKVGAQPIVCDVDLDSQNITAKEISKHITKRTKAVIVVHLAGWPCDMDSILQIANSYNLKVIEDCAQAHGAKYKNRYVGTIGDIGAFSFCQDKIMTTGGEGGMIITNNENYYNYIWSHKDHGKNLDKAYAQKNHAIFPYMHDIFGSNFRLSEMQSVIGRLHLKKLPLWLVQRKKNANIYTKSFLNITSFRVTLPDINCVHSYYKYYVFLRKANLVWSREKIIAKINSYNVPCFTGICPEIYLENAFTKYNLQPEKRFLNAKILGETSLMFVLHPTLTESNIERACDIIQNVMRKAENGKIIV